MYFFTGNALSDFPKFDILYSCLWPIQRIEYNTVILCKIKPVSKIVKINSIMKNLSKLVKHGRGAQTFDHQCNL